MKEILEKLYWEQLAEEGITKEDLEMVYLDIEFSPVIPFKGGDPVEALLTMGDHYQVLHPLVNNPVSPEQLKVMRYRYLVDDRRRKNWRF